MIKAPKNKAKTSSLVGMIIGGVCLLAVFISFLVKFFISDDFNLTFENSCCMILLGIAPSIPFSPVYISLWLDKIKEIKGIKKNE